MARREPKKKRPPRTAAQRRARKRKRKGVHDVAVYFVCPICGWDHARADCPESMR